MELSLLLAAAALLAFGQFQVHDENRPQPKVVDPGPASEKPKAPPSDALVLFDGSGLAQWRTKKDGSPAKWKVEKGYMEVVAGTGDIQTAQGFGDCQLHVEWAAPAVVSGEGQHRGNSGVFLMGQYEVQVLDSHGNKTYPDGQAAALFGQYPPLVNTSRPPGQWQEFDILFRAPRFDAQGKLLAPARVTILHNGVLVQDNRVLTGPTAFQKRPPYAAHPDKLPVGLQDHDYPVRYRNIWIRELPDDEEQLPRG
jgi:3-keto-disaccharide hydrolase